MIDVDEIRCAWPAPAGDRFNWQLAVDNLRSLAANFRARGARVIVAAGVIEDAGETPRVADAIGAERMRLAGDP